MVIYFLTIRLTDFCCTFLPLLFLPSLPPGLPGLFGRAGGGSGGGGGGRRRTRGGGGRRCHRWRLLDLGLFLRAGSLWLGGCLKTHLDGLLDGVFLTETIFGRYFSELQDFFLFVDEITS